MIVEGELGDIGTGSQIHEPAPDLVKGLTSAAKARQFVESTGVECLPGRWQHARHAEKYGVGRNEKALGYCENRSNQEATQVPLTPHGGSATDDEDLRKAIAAGINAIHMNTELRVAWRRGLDEALVKEPGEVVPYRILPSIVESVQQVARSWLRLFSNR